MDRELGHAPFSAYRALGIVLSDAGRRTGKLAAAPLIRLFALQHLLHHTPGVAYAGYVNTSSGIDYANFEAGPVPNPMPDTNDLVGADINSFLSATIDFQPWVERASQIRSSGNRGFCIGNLSIALAVGNAYAFGMASSNTLLSLIPTAGVLIGAPARELWVLYKLCPLAGILSILLSLGGNIVPVEVNDYKNIGDFTYQGMVPVADASFPPRENETGGSTGKSEAEKFADEVAQRAKKDWGVRPTRSIAGGMILQAVAIGTILVACWFLESGSVLVWWCESQCWMFVWYMFVCISAILENFAGVPFTHTWTIRIWRAPPVDIDKDAPWVISPTDENVSKVESGMQEQPSPSTSSRERAKSPFDEGAAGGSRKSEWRTEKADFEGSNASVLDRLERGYSTKGAVGMDLKKPRSQANDAFYVLLSVKGIQHGHAALRILSKAISIGTFAFSTGLFASAALVTLLRATIVTSLILAAGIFGRVTAMWMTSAMMDKRPVLHRVVESRQQAGEFLEAIFCVPGIACEVKDHIVIKGRCVKRFKMPVRWSSVLGVLAHPYDLVGIAVDRGHEQSPRILEQG